MSLVFFAGLIINVPGAAYLVGLKDIAAGKYSTGAEIALIVGFNLIMFALAEIPLAGLLIAPERTQAMVDRFNHWLSSHSRQIAIVLCAFLGAVPGRPRDRELVAQVAVAPHAAAIVGASA